MNHDSNFRAEFPSTTWTLIQQVQEADSDEQRESLNSLMKLYWKPLYSGFRAAGQSKQDAEDLVQGFFVELVAKQHLQKVSRQQSRFRAWLCTCARNYLRDQLRRRRAQKRQPTERLLLFEDLRRETGTAYEPAGSDLAANFTEAWRRDVLHRALAAVKVKAEARGRPGDFQVFIDYYCADAERKPTWKQLADSYGLADWKMAARRADWVKGQLAAAIRDEIRDYVDTDAEVDDEIRDLLD